MAPNLADAVPVPPQVEGLEPKALWKYFGQITQLPRPSKHEERILDWLKAFAAERSLETVQDKVGNLVIKRPGSGGGEDAPPVIVQGHVDMVTEKNNDVEHDFFKDPLTLRLEEDWLMATGTTLGADNGIGVAAALALLDMPSDAKLPPIEALFTVDEETGLTGAFDLDGSMLKGRVMLNLDTEDWGEIFIGCAGGGDTKIDLPAETEACPTGCERVEVTVNGLLGGHSGLNINEDRGNAVRLAARVARTALKTIPGAALLDIVGGDKRNAIAREASAILAIPTEEQGVLKDLVQTLESDIKSEYGVLETDLSVSASVGGDLPSDALTADCAARLLTLLTTLPHGALKYSHAVPGLVETSNNVASVQRTESGFHVVTSTRSSLTPALEAERAKIADIAALCGAVVEQEDAYPGWAPNPKSKLLDLCKQVFEKQMGHGPEIKAIHAGLECGILGEKLPGLDCVSFGPTIRGAHSPDERVQVSTVGPFWEAVLTIMDRLADK